MSWSDTLLISTRPEADNRQLAPLLSPLPYRLLSLPASEIAPIEDETLRQQIVSCDADLWCFPSRHAAAALRWLEPHRRQTITAACPGPGTARVLASMGVRNILQPAAEFTSEALLALPELQSVQGWRVALLTAPGGRPLIAETLRERGATVDEYPVYRRIEPAPATQALALLRADRAPWMTLVTSAQGLDYLQRQLPDELWRRLLAQPIIVPSQRVAAIAAGLGATITHVVRPPDNATISAYLQQRASG
ncbi:MAG: uroporphyrinogen-III synthase [Wenzhouxiangellaceae bacterium]